MKVKISLISLFFLFIGMNNAFAHGGGGGFMLIIMIVAYLPAIAILVGLLIATFKMKIFLNYLRVACILCILGGFYFSKGGYVLPIYTLVFHQDGDDIVRIILFYILQVGLFSGLWGMIHK